MRFGIITFHWAINYGAVLQAYALQAFLKQKYPNSVIEIINYFPKRYRKSMIRCFLHRNISMLPQRIAEQLRERQIRKFRNEHLTLTEHYSTIDELRRQCQGYDVLICGSDQIWNPFFTRRGERGLTYSYFLDFGNPRSRKIAYAVSFGCTKYPDDLLGLIKPKIEQLHFISVRENTGLDILREIGVSRGQRVPDPVLLLSVNDYTKLLDRDHGVSCHRKALVYLLRRNRDEELAEAHRILKIAKMNIEIEQTGARKVESWLEAIRTCSIVITNSFHASVFSLLFHKQFLFIPEKGQGEGMNDRVVSLLKGIGLEGQILWNTKEETLKDAISTQTDWDKIDAYISSEREKGGNFLMLALEGVLYHNEQKCK